MRTLWTDEDLLTTMNIGIVEGRYFAKEFPADSASSVVLNETAVRQLGWTPEEALGKRVKLAQFDSVYQQVIGVVKDYHFTSLKERIEPLVIGYRPNGRNLLLKFSETNLQDAVASLEKLWGSYQTGFPMEFSFLDDTLGSLYVRETVQGKLFSVFSIISHRDCLPRNFRACILHGRATKKRDRHKESAGSYRKSVVRVTGEGLVVPCLDGQSHCHTARLLGYPSMV